MNGGSKVCWFGKEGAGLLAIALVAVECVGMEVEGL